MNTVTTRFCTTALALGSLAGTTARVAQADVFSYGLTRTMSHYQISNAQPAEPFAWGTIAIVATDTPGELLSGELSFELPPTVSYPMPEAVPTMRQFTSAFYDTELDMLAQFPGTTYTITVDRGAGPESATVDVDASLYCDEAPFLTGDTFTRMQCVDSTLPFDGTINGFIPAPGTTHASTYIAVVPDLGEGVIWAVILEPGETAFQIPENTMEPGLGYTIGISYINSILTPEAGFGLATASADFIRDTNAAFHTHAIRCTLADITEVGGVAESPGCPDGQLTVDDIIVFVNLFSDGTGCPGIEGSPCSRADVTAVGGPPEPPDGQLTVDDIIAFFNAFSDGC